ncbi:MAG: putative adenylyltransferase/sulfurtransferase MoeZ [Firmicutes bacterium ADurb.Bin182]|nr:MAG: putative adenylyltransferase/sulfurtransferase MoeZ [Firmicutes bacterium ADurb.Bin182]
MRYSRQIMMKQIGESGQDRLKNSSVLVVGAGGLGSSALYYLAAAGVGRIGVLDYDAVSLSNLNRQILHFTSDIGSEKAYSATQKLSSLNPEITLEPHVVRLAEENAEELFSGYDIVVAAVDSVSVRHIINRTCVRLKKTMVEGGIEGFRGMILCVKPGITPCYHCVYRDTFLDEGAVGVVGATAGIIGSLEAMCAIQILLGIDRELDNKLIYFDALTMTLEHISVKRDEQCPVCSGSAEP